MAAEVIEPRFANLADGDVAEKAPNKLVSRADTEAEAVLARRLGELLTGVPVVGEEATSLDDVPYDFLGAAERVWLIDPRGNVRWLRRQLVVGAR